MVVANNRWAPRGAPKDKITRLRAYVHRVMLERGKAAGRDAIRELCRRDLFYLCYEVLNYRDLVEPLHDDLCDFLADAARRKVTDVTLIPRGHFKSTLATVGRCIQWMIQDHNTAIGLGSADLKSAKKFLREIRQQLEQNAKLKSLFPEIFWQHPTREAPKWTEEEIQIKRDKVKKEGTIKVFGLEDGLPTGDHYDHMVIDDAVNEDNVRTPERLAKVLEQSKYLQPLLVTPDQPISWVGTRYHIHDVYEGLIKDADTAVYYRQATENEEPIFPQRFTAAILEKTRVKMGSYIFSCQYMMEPVDPADKKFLRAWLKYYTKEIGASYGHVFFLTVDPASRQRKKSDFTAMLVFGLDKDWNFYLVDGIHDKLNPAQRIAAVFHLVRKWGIGVVGYETIGFQETDQFFIQQKMVKDNFYFEIVEVTNHKLNKNARIEGLQPIMENGHFHLPAAGMPYKRQWENPDDGLGKLVDIKEEFLREFDTYPNSAHDDLLDVATMAREVAYAGHIPIPEGDFSGGTDYNVAALLGQEEEERSPLV